MSETDLRQLRGRILAAARELSTQSGSALQLGEDQLVAAAGITPAQFAEAYTDRRAYLLALLLDFLDRARADAIDTLAQSPPGIPRICAAFERYWDSNLKWRPMRELALHFRGDAEGAEILRARLHGVTMIAQYELDGVGWPYPAAAARLVANLCVETAVIEYEAGRALPEVRYSALAYLREPRPKGIDEGTVP
jgi:TetR/AcrR family transcriptional regulator, transcriptional repressor for nem operon